MLVHTLGTSWHQHVVAQVVLLTHLSSPNAATLKHERLFVCLPCPSNATRRLRCTCLHASHLLVLPCGAWAQLFTHPPFPSNVMWPEHIYVPTCCVSAVSSDGPGMPAYVPSISWGSHLLAGACLNFYLSSVPELTCSNSKSPVHIIGTTAEFQQCHEARFFMPAMSQCHHMVVWKCLCMPARPQGLAAQTFRCVQVSCLSADTWQ